jgi:transposase
MDLALAIPPVRPMGQRTLVPDAGEVVLHELKTDGQNRLVMVLRSAGEEGRCPECGRPSRRVHSRYKRRLSDLPWEGIPVGIELRVRRFFCTEENCAQHIFTERLPNTVARHSRRTRRLSAALNQITLALGGSAGSRLAEQLGILTNGSTLLRGLRKRSSASSPRPLRVVGIDDWAWRKGQRYGTILCDLESGKVVDLLPDRSTISTAAWLMAHPEIEIISRDRASLYAEAATKAAPQAVQVADRWHLLRNLSEALVEALAPHHRLLAEVARTTAKESEPEAEAVVKPPSAKPTSRHRRLIQGNRERRMARYEAVMALFQKGIAQREIARQCGLSRKTVRRFIRAQGFPERKQRRRSSLIDRHRDYLEMRWQQGCHNSAQLYRELRSQGFAIRPHALRDWMHKHYGPRGHRNQLRSHRSTPLRASPRQVAWWLLKQPEDARSYLEQLDLRCPEITSCAVLAREFFRIIRDRDTTAWPIWRDATALSPFASFTRHLCRDEAAFLAALKHPWSNGPVEGHVHRLKLIKRSMYGRAKFDLLRLRVLNAA